MKKIYLFPALAATLMISGCDYNEKYFEGLDEMSQPKEVFTKTYALTEADYATISSGKAYESLPGSDEEKAALAALKTSMRFSDILPASKYLSTFLAAKWLGADDGSSVKVTYNKGIDAPEYLAKLAASETYTVSDANYVSVWGDVDAKYFTPSKPLAKVANKILTTAYPTAQSGDVKVVAYNYSISEPNTGGGATVAKELDETFDHISVGGGKTAIDGWQNIAEKGTKYWTDKYYNGGYTECSAYNGGGDVIAWLISPKVDLSSAAAPKLAFDVCLGYPNGATLQILVSDDFNGSDVNSATWTDLTAYFAFDASNAKYGTMSPAGIYDMSAYKENPVYIAFKYVGNAEKTTTFQIDNIQLGDNVSVEATSVFKEDFENGTDAWKEQIIQGDFTWTAKDFSNNHYVQYSANKSTEEQESYYISPAITIPVKTEGVAELLFDVCIGYWNANCLSVLVSTDYVDDVTKATWKDMTAEFALPEGPTNAYGKFGYAGAAPLNEFAGQVIHVAFRYVGNGAESRSTTYQIDNIKVQTVARKAAVAKLSTTTRATAGGVNELATIYTYNGSTWIPYEDAIVVSPSDYEEMGFETFTSSNKPDNYLPQFLTANYPYAQEEQKVGVVYTYSNNQEAAEYIYTAGVWTKNDNVEVVTDQFVRSEGKWNFNPSTTITLSVVKNDPVSTPFYQAIVDYSGTKHGKDYYQTGYTNAEYYYGASSYQNNFDFRPSAWKTKHNNGALYEKMSDEDLVKLMFERLPEAFVPALEALYGDANVVSGVEVIYTIYFGVYDGSTTVTWTIQYEVIGKGKFQYIEGSLKKAE